MKNKTIKKALKILLIIVIIALFIIIAYTTYLIISQTNKKVYSASDFGIEEIKSKNDKNNNGIDDYTDILLGARKDAENKPTYVSKYYSGGYPPENEGVCADVIWRAFENAGYNLKEMIDTDIKNNLDKYPRVEGKPDTNIDFRRVPNLKIFFERYATKLTEDLEKISEWQPRRHSYIWKK